MEGTVMATSHDIFTVKIDGDKEWFVEAKPSGKIRIQHIRITDGDRVILEISPYDLKRGRIVYRKSGRIQEAT